MKQFKYFIIPLVISVAAGLIYLFTAAPSMLWLDAPDFIAASVKLGINNPPAPLFVFLAHFFTLLPFGSIIFRFQLFTAIQASISLFLLYLIIFKTSEKINIGKMKVDFSERIITLGSIFGVLTLAFSYEFWSQAQNTDRFILACLLELVVIYLLTVVNVQKKQFLILIISVFILGISTGIDPVVISFFPSFFLVLFQKRQSMSLVKLLQLGTVGLAGVLLVYSYLPIMSHNNPFLNYGRPTNLSAIWAVATGQGLNVNNTNSGHVNGFTGSINIFIKSSWLFLLMVWQSFTPFLIPFILLGGWYVWKTLKRIFWITSLIILTNFLLSGIYLSGNQYSWFLLSDVIFAIFAGLGFMSIADKLTSKAWHPGFIYILLLFSLLPFCFWWSTLDRHNWRLTDDYIHNIYNPIKQPAILFGGSDLFIDSSYYVYDATNYKPGIIPIIDSEFYLDKSYRDNLRATVNIKIPNTMNMTFNNPDEYNTFVNNFFTENLSKYRIYINYPAFSPSFILTSYGVSTLKIDTNRFRLIPSGLVEEVVFKENKLLSKTNNFNYQFSNNFPAKKPVFLEQSYNEQLNGMLNEYASSYNSMGDYLMQRREADEALSYYQKSVAVNPQNEATLDKLGLFYVSLKQYKKAILYFTKIQKIDPTNQHNLFNIALMKDYLGKTEDAKKLLQQLLVSAKDEPQVIEEATQALKALGVNATLPQDSWKIFTDEQINLTFNYPPGFIIRAISPTQIGMFADNGDAVTPTITFYTQKVDLPMTLDTFANTFPYAVKGTLTTNESVSLPNFQEAKIKAYKSGQDNTELVLLRQGNQIFAMTIPLGENTNNLSFAKILDSVLRSINTLNE